MYTNRLISKKTARKQAASQRRGVARPLSVEECEARNLLATFTVTSPLDTGAAGELRWAVTSANTSPGADLINFAPNINQIALVQGELAITDAVNIRSLATDLAPIEIHASANSRIFRIDDSNPATKVPVRISSLRLSEGDVTPLNGQGGAILNAEDLTLVNSAIANNEAAAGGGIANLGVLTVRDSRFFDNAADLDGGGGIWNGPDAAMSIAGGVIGNNATLLGLGGGILNDGGFVWISGGASLNGNTAGAAGGGLAIQNGGEADLNNVDIEFNESAVGGGIFAGDSGSTVVMQNSRVTSNQANSGGGVALSDESAGFVRNSVLLFNSAFFDGGGVLVADAATLELSGSEVTGNQAGFLGPPTGRGAGIFASEGVSVAVSSSGISFNGVFPSGTLVTSGGGIFAGNSVDLSVENSLISGNAALHGGGLYASPSNAVDPASNARTEIWIEDSILEDNSAIHSGGGILAGPFVSLDLKCVTVAGNFSEQTGGGMHLTGAPGPRGVLANVVQSFVSANRAGQFGGGISSADNVELTIDHSVVSDNHAGTRGGGLHLVGDNITPAGPNRTLVNRSLISGNEAPDPGGPAIQDQAGGGMWAGPGTFVEIDASTIQDNHAGTRGGGIAVTGAQSFLLQNSTVSGNGSLNGGGASVVSANATFLQTTFYANYARRNGGGIHIQSTNSSGVDILHSTLSLNSAGRDGSGRGGAIYIGGAAGDAARTHLDHTIVSTNLGPPLGGFDEIFDATSPSGVAGLTARYSLVRDNRGTNLAPGNPDPQGNLIGTPDNPIDALLGPLGDAGGPTLTMVPSNLSPVINAGDPLFTGPPTGDQRLLPFKRVVFGRVDIGSVELQPAPPDPDFNNDGRANCADIDALVVEIVAGTNAPRFDLTGDGLVDREDLHKWLEDAPAINGLAIARYLPGDANLDTVVDTSDFNIWNANKFTLNAAWCRGDFNASGFVDTSDFNIWNANKFTASPPATDCGFFTEDGPPSLTRSIQLVTMEPRQPLADFSAGRLNSIPSRQDAAVDDFRQKRFEALESPRHGQSKSTVEGELVRASALQEVLAEWDAGPI